MNTGMPLLITLIVTIIFSAVIQIIFFRHRKKQKAAYPILWEQFQLSLKKESHHDIIEVGNKLIYNKFVSTKHLEIIHKTAKELESKNPAFEKLRLNAYDKWIHHTKGQGYGC